MITVSDRDAASQTLGAVSNRNAAAENWSWMSVASSGSAHHGGRRGRPYPWLRAATLTDLIDRRTDRRPPASRGRGAAVVSLDCGGIEPTERCFLAALARAVGALRAGPPGRTPPMATVAEAAAALRGLGDRVGEPPTTPSATTSGHPPPTAG